MTQKTFTIETSYALSGIKQDGTRVYYDIDSHSGGYPYWSTYASNAKKFKDLTKVPTLAKKDYLRTEVVKLEIIKVSLCATVVESTDLVSAAAVKAMAEIDQIKKDLACKIAALEGM